jgi:hypothetical protein
MTTLSSSASLMEATPRARPSNTTLLAVGLVALLALVGGGILLVRQGEEQHAASAPKEPTQEMAAGIDDTSGTQLPAAGQDDTVAPLEHTNGSRDTEAINEIPPVPDVTPERVAVQIASKPAGAEVFVDSEGQARGKTPLTVELARSEESVTLTLKRSGYKDSVQQIIPRKSGQLVWSLSRVREEERPLRQSAGRKLNRGLDDNVTLQPDL